MVLVLRRARLPQASPTMRTTLLLPVLGIREILAAIDAVIRVQGGMAAVNGPEISVLPLDCAGLCPPCPPAWSSHRLDALREATAKMGGIADPFMYLSFLALTVIPALRITDRGLFDGVAFRDVAMFEKEEPSA